MGGGGERRRCPKLWRNRQLQVEDGLVKAIQVGESAWKALHFVTLRSRRGKIAHAIAHVQLSPRRAPRRDPGL